MDKVVKMQTLSIKMAVFMDSSEFFNAIYCFSEYDILNLLGSRNLNAADSVRFLLWKSAN